MQDLYDKIISVTIGIRFKRSFRIPDISGEIIDDLLSHSKSPFTENFFPRIDTSQWEKVLYNDKTDDYLRINTDDLILNIQVDHNFATKFEWLKNNVINYLQGHLFPKYNIKNIRRFGVVFSHKITPNGKLDNAVAQLTENEVTNPNEVSVAFSKKAPTEEAVLRKSVNDYKNRIYSLQESNKVVRASLDFQYYYDPIIEDFRECFVDRIFVDADNYLKQNFHTWLNKYEAQ